MNYSLPHGRWMTLRRPIRNTTQSRTKRFSNVFRKTEKLLTGKVSTSRLSSSHTIFSPFSTFISPSSSIVLSSFPSGMMCLRTGLLCLHRWTPMHTMRWYTYSSVPLLAPFSPSFSKNGDGKGKDQSRTLFSGTSPTSLSEYVIERSFDEPTLRFLLEGYLVDVKQEIREALIGVLPPPPRHFSSRKGREQEIHFYRGGGESGIGGGDTTYSTSHSTSSTDQGNHRKRAFSSSTTAFRGVEPISPVATKLLLRAFLQRRLGVSYAMYRSSMDRLLALYETVAMAHPVLASVLAQHFTAAGLLASHGAPSLLQRYSHWLDGADSGHILGTVATHELIAEEGPPVNTEAVYDFHEKCFVLRGTGKFAVVGAMMADYVIVSAVLTTKKNENNGVHLFVVPLREEEGGRRGEESLNEHKKEKWNGAGKVKGNSTENASQAPPRFSSLGSRRSDIKLEPIEGEGDVFTASGTGVIYFDHTRIPSDHLLGPFRMDEATGSVFLPNNFSDRKDEANEKKKNNASHEKGSTVVHEEKKMEGSASFQSSCFSLLSSMVGRMTPLSAMFSSWMRLKPFRTLGTFVRTSEGVKEGNMHSSPMSSSSFPLHWWFSSAIRMGGGKRRREEEMETAGEVLRFRFRLASSAITLGILKKQVRDAVQYTSQQHIIGPSGFRDYPYFGLQEVQTPLVTLVVKASVFTLAWNQYLQQWLSLSATSKEQGGFSTSSSSSSLTWRDRQTRLMQLTGLLSMLDSVVLFELEDFRRRFTHVHAFFTSTGAESWSNATIQLRQEYRNQHERLREVARSSVVFNIGSTHWGWRLSSVARRFPSFQRFFQNPLYSPRIADLSRHYLFFSHQHYGLKKRLQRALQVETRRGGTSHAWHDWRTFRHGDVVRCGEAYMEVYLMNGMIEAVQQCSNDLRCRKLLRDIAWIFALSRQKDLLGYYVTTGLLSRQKGLILIPHLENLCTVFAPQARHVAEALCGRWYDGDEGRSHHRMGDRSTEEWGSAVSQVPPTTSGMQHSRRMAEAAAALCDAPCASEAYWTIIGASTRPERGESLATTTRPGRRSGKGTNGRESGVEEEDEEEEGTKEAEDRVQEDWSEWDMLHGLGSVSKRERKEMQEREEKGFGEENKEERKRERVMKRTA